MSHRVLAVCASVGFLVMMPMRTVCAAQYEALPAPGTSQSDRITEQPRLKPGVKDVSKLPPLKSKVPSQTDFAGGVGPMVLEFSQIKSACPYPDPKARILKYRVAAAPDGSPVARIQVWRNLAGGASALAYSSPAPGSSSVQLENSAGIADAGADARTVAYVLQATDSRNRSHSTRLPFHYKNPRDLARNIELVRPNVNYDSSRRDYVYDLSVRVRALEIRSLAVTLRGWDSAQRERASLANIRPELPGQALPTGYIAQARELRARFRAGINITQNYRWGVELAVEAAPPGGCSSQVRMPVLFAQMTERGTPYVPPPSGVVIGGGSSGCPGEGEACTTRPTACFGREAGFQVTGRKVCERGSAVCRAEAGRDYCTACGGACGACVTQLCSRASPCPPGSICGYERTATGTQMRCRSLTVPEASTGRVPCTPRTGMCWLPSELKYEPTEKDLAYALYCANPE